MSTTATKMEGKVKFWNKEKAYGFIKANDGTEHFVHHTGLIDQIRQDDNVSFVLKEGTKGPNAVEVTLI